MTEDATNLDSDAIVMPRTSTDPALLKEEAVIKEASDSSPDSAEATQEAQAHETQPKTDGIQERFNKITAQKYAEQRRAEELERKLAELEAKQSTSPTVDVQAPQMPNDLYDEEAMRKYHEDMIKYQTEIATVTAKTTFESQQNERLKQEQEAGRQKKLQSYVQNGIRDGVDVEKMRAVETTLVQSGISPQLGDYLETDVNGAKVAEYLVDNPAVMHEVLSLDPVTAGIKIATEIKPRALSKTPKVSGAPDPIPDVKGGGVSEKDDFEKMFPGAEII